MRWCVIAGWWMMAGMGMAQEKFVPNYDEAKAAPWPVPDVLTALDGSRVSTREAWLEKRRPEVLRWFAEEVYGKTPVREVGMEVRMLAADKEVLRGKGIMRQTELVFAGGGLKARVLLFLPKKSTAAQAPVFLGLNFGGNHSVFGDPAIVLSPGWFRNNEAQGYVNHRATEASRGSSENRWPVAALLERGYGVATAYYGDFDPDFDDGFQNGVQPLFYAEGQQTPRADEWGSIGAWAWGLSRMADYLRTVPEVDGQKLAVVGHSRLGKAALWAGAQDERFAIVISNNSGAGGAALSKRIFGETVGRLNSAFPHWFCGNFKKYSNNEQALAMDQHALVALMVPRPVYIASATEDKWADPKGEFLGGKLAEPVYALFGKAGLGVDAMPEPDRSVGGTIGYHLRTGKHDITPFDWERYMDFAERHWSR